MSNEERATIMHNAIAVYGERAQIVKALEEIAELAAELSRYLNGICNSDSVREELADANIMLTQMGMIFGDVSEIEEYKLRRLETRMGAIDGD